MVKGEQIRNRSLTICFFHDDKVKLLRQLNSIDRARIKFLGLESFAYRVDNNNRLKELWGFKSAVPDYKARVVKIL